MTTTITAGSRLHFGLLAVPAAAGGQAARRFGGAGLMTEQQRLSLSVQPALAWSANGPSADRVLAFARRLMTTLPASEQHRSFALTVEACGPEHVGLGVGTQLALAVARALTVHTGLENEDAASLARRVGRGLRSSLGIHGFQHGGLLIEGGKTDDSAIAPLLARQVFPDDWQILLIIPQGIQGTHGTRELDAFAHVTGDDSLRRTDALCRLALLGMLPALIERDLARFGEAVHEFNRKAGEWFQAWQGGVYSHPRVAELVAAIRGQGIPGVGQSSWGPTVFAIATGDRLNALRECLLNSGVCRAEELLLTSASNRGAWDSK
jgi:beta-ribofuranosylaminobenzene 5'-phosphate synthase